MSSDSSDNENDYKGLKGQNHSREQESPARSESPSKDYDLSHSPAKSGSRSPSPRDPNSREWAIRASRNGSEEQSQMEAEEHEDSRKNESDLHNKSASRSKSRSASRSRSNSKDSRSPAKKRSRRSRSRSLSRRRSRSPRRSRSRSRRRSRSRSRGRYRRSRSRGRRRSRSRTPIDGARLHVAEIDVETRKRDLEKLYEKYGRIKEIWMARNPPCFAFVVFQRQKDADDAMRETDGLMIGHSRIKVTLARPRVRGGRFRGYDPNLRCYQCGELGHFSRNCTDTKFGYKRPPTPPGTYRGGSSHVVSRRRSRSRERHRSRS